MNLPSSTPVFDPATDEQLIRLDEEGYVAASFTCIDETVYVLSMAKHPTDEHAVYDVLIRRRHPRHGYLTSTVQLAGASRWEPAVNAAMSYLSDFLESNGQQVR